MKVLLLFFMITNINAITILIDPGHGGDSLGAKTVYRGRVIYEKDIALSIAKKIYNRLKKYHHVYLTRSIDRSVDLKTRALMAEKINADLFISIHLNSSRNKKANGEEVYYLDNHKNIAIKAVERVENKELTGDELIVNKILIDLIIERTSPKSNLLANIVHKELSLKMKGRFYLRDRGVRPGIFYVLAFSKIPAILVEAGFISNNRDLKKLINDKFQNRFAATVANGIKKYINQTYIEEIPRL